MFETIQKYCAFDRLAFILTQTLFNVSCNDTMPSFLERYADAVVVSSAKRLGYSSDPTIAIMANSLILLETASISDKASAAAALLQTSQAVIDGCEHFTPTKMQLTDDEEAVLYDYQPITASLSITEGFLNRYIQDPDGDPDLPLGYARQMLREAENHRKIFTNLMAHAA